MTDPREDDDVVVVDISRAVGETIVKHFEELGLVLVPKALAIAAYRAADALDVNSSDPCLDVEQLQAVARLINEVAVARLREPGEPTT